MQDTSQDSTNCRCVKRGDGSSDFSQSDIMKVSDYTCFFVRGDQFRHESPGRGVVVCVIGHPFAALLFFLLRGFHDAVSVEYTP